MVVGTTIGGHGKIDNPIGEEGVGSSCSMLATPDGRRPLAPPGNRVTTGGMNGQKTDSSGLACGGGDGVGTDCRADTVCPMIWRGTRTRVVGVQTPGHVAVGG